MAGAGGDRGRHPSLRARSATRLNTRRRSSPGERRLRGRPGLDADAFAERFDVGHGRTYGCIEQMLSCIDVPLLVEMLSQVEPEKV